MDSESWATERVKIEFSRDAGATWSTVQESAPNTGGFLWSVDGPGTTKARVRVSWTDNPAVQDASNVNFTIAAPFITVSKPNGGERWKKGSAQTAVWTSNLGSAEFVKIELSNDGGVSWLSVAESAQAGTDASGVDPLSTLVGSTPSDGNQKIVLPGATSSKYRVRVTWLESAGVSDSSNGNFAIIP